MVKLTEMLWKDTSHDGLFQLEANTFINQNG